MKKLLWMTISLVLAGFVFAEDAARVKVSGDRVSLRAAPELTAVLMGRAMSGDLLALVDNSNPEWVGVSPPETIDVWVHSNFIEDGAVVPARLNVRSGPSLSHGVVGVIERGAEVKLRGETGKWLRIAPPEETVLWISRDYVEVFMPEPMVEADSVLEIPKELVMPEEVVEETSAVVVAVPEEFEEPVAESVSKVMAVENVSEAVIDEVAVVPVSLPGRLIPNSAYEQGVVESFVGVLNPTGALLTPLQDLTVETITVCYVRGNAEQVAELAGKPVKITGKTYWALDLDSPFVVPEKLELIEQD